MGSQSTREFTKVVIRQLPPTLQEADCKAAFDKEFADRYNWFSFSRGKIGQKTTRQSRAYLNFKAAADVLDFKAAFDGASFTDAHGRQQPCSVEYAPFQRVPRGRVKRDPREGTIEKDAAYKVFLEELERQPEALPTAEQQLDQKLEAGAGDGADSRIVTPLMAFFQEKSAPKDREKKAAPARKAGVRGRGLVGSALASIFEAVEGGGSSSGARKQSKASSRAATRDEATDQRASGSKSSTAAAGDSAQAAREAARRALGSLRLSGEPQPGPADSSTATDGDAPAQPKAKTRDAPAKEPKLRPGFGTFVPRGARQQDAGNSSGSGGATTSDSGAAPGSASVAAKVRAAAAAAQAPARASKTGGHAQKQQSSSPRQQKQKQPTSPRQPKQQPALPRQQKQQRGRCGERQTGGDKGDKQGDKQVASGHPVLPLDPSLGASVSTQTQAPGGSGDSAAEATGQPPAGSSRRQRGRGAARAPAAAVTTAEGAPAPGAQAAEAAAESAVQPAGGAAKKAGRHRGRPKKAGGAESHD